MDHFFLLLIMLFSHGLNVIDATIIECFGTQLLPFDDASLVVISKQQMTSEEASNFCLRYGAVLYVPESSDKTAVLKKYASKKLAFADSVKLCAFSYRAGDVQYQYDLARENVHCVPSQSQKIPVEGYVRSLHLSHAETSQTRVAIRVCRSQQQRPHQVFIDRDCSNMSPHLIAYGSDFHGSDVDHVYSFFVQTLRSSGRIDVNTGPATSSTFSTPEISLFVGATSLKHSRTWVWGNNEMVVDQSIPLSKPEFCEQMTLPLTYDTGINLVPKSCSHKTYAACFVDLQVVAQRFNCEGSMRIAWNNALARFKSWDISKVEVKAVYKDEQDVQMAVFPYTDYVMFFRRTTSAKNSSISVSFRHSECAFNISAITILVPSVAEMTKNRRPPPVSRAIVTRKENTNKFECLFHIENDLSAVGIVFYEILVEDQIYRIENVYERDPSNITSFDKKIVSGMLDLSSSKFSDYDVLPEVKIRAHNCIGPSPEVEVMGECLNPFSPLSFEQLVKYMAVFLVLFGVMCVMGAYCLHWVLLLSSAVEPKEDDKYFDAEDVASHVKDSQRHVTFTTRNLQKQVAPPSVEQKANVQARSTPVPPVSSPQRIAIPPQRIPSEAESFSSVCGGGPIPNNASFPNSLPHASIPATVVQDGSPYPSTQKVQYATPQANSKAYFDKITTAASQAKNTKRQLTVRKPSRDEKRYSDVEEKIYSDDDEKMYDSHGYQ